MLGETINGPVALVGTGIDMRPCGLNERDKVALKPRCLFVLGARLRGNPLGNDSIDLGKKGVRRKHLSGNCLYFDNW